MTPSHPISQNGKSPRVVLVGDINVDVFFQIAAYPPAGGDGLAETMLAQAGGSVANTALMLARLGADAILTGRVGRDHWAGMALDALAGAGVDVSAVCQDEADGTGITFLTVTPDGERTMFSYRGANRRVSPQDISAELMQGADWLHLSGYALLASPQRDAAWKAVELARQAGMPVSLDMGVEPAHALGNDLARLLEGLDTLILGVPEAIVLTGVDQPEAALARLQEMGVRCLGLKLGKGGCRIVTREAQAEIPGLAVPTVDTTGAGDAFGAGLIVARAAGLSLAACGLLANGCGALATTRWGAGAALPLREEVRAALTERAADFAGLEDALREVLEIL